MTHASVFSGIGGPEIAASMLGWNNLFHCEINPFGRKILRYWFPKAESYEDYRCWAIELKCSSSLRNDGKDVSFVRIESAMINEKHHG